jgi:protein-tyrosine-phosphatase
LRGNCAERAYAGAVDPELERSLPRCPAILFLCSGNAVRSAFCEVYARHLGCARPVLSAATIYRNERMLLETRRALETRGVAPSETVRFRPRHVEDLLPGLDPGTVVLGMTRVHLEAISARADLCRQARLLPAVCGEPGEVLDPVMDGADFASTFERLARYVRALTSALDQAQADRT